MCGMSDNEGHYYDFSSLRKRHGGYYSVNDDWKINICEGVTSCNKRRNDLMDFYNDDALTSVCKMDPKNDSVTPASYGLKYASRFSYDPLNGVSLYYGMGDYCQQGKTYDSKFKAAVIQFKCNPKIYQGMNFGILFLNLK